MSRAAKDGNNFRREWDKEAFEARARARLDAELALEEEREEKKTVAQPIVQRAPLLSRVAVFPPCGRNGARLVGVRVHLWGCERGGTVGQFLARRTSLGGHRHAPAIEAASVSARAQWSRLLEQQQQPSDERNMPEWGRSTRNRQQVRNGRRFQLFSKRQTGRCEPRHSPTCYALPSSF